MKTKRYLVLVIIVFFALSLTGCSGKDMKETIITFDGNSVNVKGHGVKITEGTVLIEKNGVYVLRGNGSGVRIETDEDAELILDGITLSSAGNPALDSKGTLRITVKEGTVNSFSVSGDKVPAVKSGGDLHIDGRGELNIDSVNGKGLTADKQLSVENASVNIRSLKAGIEAGEIVLIDAHVHIESGSDGIRTLYGDTELKDSEIIIRAGSDGISAKGSVIIHSSDIDIFAGKGHEQGKGEVSAKGIKAGNEIFLDGGNVTLDTEDDGLHAKNGIEIRDGGLTVRSGDDAVHSDGMLAVSGGTTEILYAHEGLEAKNVMLTGGSITVITEEDGINASDGLTVDGADIIIESGGDGLDSNGFIRIVSGRLRIISDSDEDTAFDHKKGFVLEGGEVFALWRGSDTMLPDCRVPALFISSEELFRDSCFFIASGEENTGARLAFDTFSVFYSGESLKVGEVSLISVKLPVDAFTGHFAENFKLDSYDRIITVKTGEGLKEISF